jgi:hypothetical protein
MTPCFRGENDSSHRFLFEPQSLAIEPIASHIEHSVESRPKIFLRSAGPKLNQLLLRKMPPQFGIQFLAHIRRRLRQSIRHLQQRGLGGSKAINTPRTDY